MEQWRPMLLLVLALGFARPGAAHVASTGFVELHVAGARIEGSLELAIRDADVAVGVDGNGDGKVTWGELKASERELIRYVAGHFRLASNSTICPLSMGALEVNTRVDGTYVWLPLEAQCSAPVSRLQIWYHLMQGVDPSHRGLLTLASKGLVQTAVLGEKEDLTLDLTSASRGRTFVEYFQAGVEHILGGIDHLLFLVSLLLPAVLVRTPRGWQPVPAGRPALIDILSVVTAFTLAHSITLSLAAFGVIHLPSRLTESVIAASIVVAALNNLFPVVTRGRARIAFGFGLLHGFGFASVLADMGLPPGARLLSLLSFNLGIEAGQLLVVLVIMPLAYACRFFRTYRQAIVPGGSALIALIALVWFVQRVSAP